MSGTVEGMRKAMKRKMMESAFKPIDNSASSQKALVPPIRSSNKFDSSSSPINPHPTTANPSVSWPNVDHPATHYHDDDQKVKAEVRHRGVRGYGFLGGVLSTILKAIVVVAVIILILWAIK